MLFVPLRSIAYITKICRPKSSKCITASPEIICADARELKSFKNLFLDGALADIIITDPPYC